MPNSMSCPALMPLTFSRMRALQGDCSAGLFSTSLERDFIFNGFIHDANPAHIRPVSLDAAGNLTNILLGDNRRAMNCAHTGNSWFSRSGDLFIAPEIPQAVMDRARTS